MSPQGIFALVILCSIGTSVVSRPNNFQPANFQPQADEYNQYLSGITLYRLAPNHTIEYLILQNLQDSEWGFPEGNIQKDEDPEKGAVRTTFNDTEYLESDYEKFFDAGKVNFEYTTKNGTTTLAHLYVAKLTATEKPIVLNPTEHKAYVWVDFEEAFYMVTEFNHQFAFYINNNYVHLIEDIPLYDS